MKIQDLLIGLYVIDTPFPSVEVKKIEEIRFCNCTGITFEEQENENCQGRWGEMCVVVWCEEQRQKERYPISKIAYLKIENDLLEEHMKELSLARAFGNMKER